MCEDFGIVFSTFVAQLCNMSFSLDFIIDADTVFSGSDRQPQVQRILVRKHFVGTK